MLDSPQICVRHETGISQSRTGHTTCRAKDGQENTKHAEPDQGLTRRLKGLEHSDLWVSENRNWDMTGNGGGSNEMLLLCT